MFVVSSSGNHGFVVAIEMRAGGVCSPKWIYSNSLLIELP
jgi:hypothetical protein